MSLTILHNPRCSKSRQTLALLEERGLTPQIREYLKQPLDTAELTALLAKLGIAAQELVRSKEAEFKEAGLDQDGRTEQDFIAAMVRFPKLMERPVVINGEQARIGRPPEQVLEIL